MTKHTQPAPDGGIPEFLKRETNAKGVTLSAGIDTSATATGAKVAVNPVERPLSKKAQKKLDAQAKRDAKAAETLVAQEVVEEQAAPTEPVEVFDAVLEHQDPQEPVHPLLAIPSASAVTLEPAVGPDGQPLKKVSRSIVPMKFKARYAKNNGVCGDDVSLELKAATTTLNADKREVLDVDVLWEIALANNIDTAKYRDLNNGQKRMNVGNKLRGKLAAGEDIVIAGRVLKAEDFVPKH